MRALQKRLFKQKIQLIKIQNSIQQQTTQKFMKNIDKINVNNTLALAISVNSKGGSPVQSQIISSRLRHFANQNKLKLYGFVTDNALSAGYHILSAADQIYADRTSLVGSIGVVWKKYNVHGLGKSLGIELCQIQTQKSLISMMNPLKQMSQQDKQILRDLANKNHQNFINMVKQNRKGRIDLSKSQLIFSGDAFSGQEGLRYGLVDGLGSYIQILNRKYPNVEIQIDNSHVNIQQKITKYI